MTENMNNNDPNVMTHVFTHKSSYVDLTDEVIFEQFIMLSISSRFSLLKWKLMISM